MSATSTLNGKPQRKQLSDQLDRLDSIIDALAEGLPGAVADACREGARAAVKDVLIEVLTNPELRALVASPQSIPAPDSSAPPPEPVAAPAAPKPSTWSRLKAKMASVRGSLTEILVKAREAVTRPYNTARNTILAIGVAAGEAFPLRRVALVGTGVGLAVGVACFVVPQTMAAIIGAAGATATTMSVQTGVWLRATARRLGLLG